MLITDRLRAAGLAWELGKARGPTHQHTARGPPGPRQLNTRGTNPKPGARAVVVTQTDRVLPAPVGKLGLPGPRGETAGKLAHRPLGEAFGSCDSRWHGAAPGPGWAGLWAGTLRRHPGG